MLNTIITHTISVLVGFFLGVVFTYITTAGLVGKDKIKVQPNATPLIEKVGVPNMPVPKTVVSQPSVPNINCKPKTSMQDGVAGQQTVAQLKQESSTEHAKPEITGQGQSATQKPEQITEKVETSEKPMTPRIATKTLKFKRLSTIREIELEITLGMKDVIARVEKELDVDTKVSRLLCKGKLLKEGFLESIPEGSTVSVMVKSEARPVVAKTLKFKRLKKTKEIKLEVTLGIKEICARVEKEFRLDAGTRVSRLVWKGKPLKDGSLESIPEGSTVSVMVKKPKSNLTEPPSTRPSTSQSAKPKDDGLDFLDSVLDRLKEPEKLTSRQSQSIHPMMDSRALDTQQTRTKMSIPKQKRIQYQVSKDILTMQKVWNRRNHGLSSIYHQGVDLVNIHSKR